jgi:hypothetical protein
VVAAAAAAPLEDAAAVAKQPVDVKKVGTPRGVAVGAASSWVIVVG